LSFNKQHTEGDKIILLNRVKTCVKEGALLKCPQCEKGHLQFKNDWYTCRGFYNIEKYSGWACDYSSKETMRRKWYIPKDIYEIIIVKREKNELTKSRRDGMNATKKRDVTNFDNNNNNNNKYQTMEKKINVDDFEEISGKKRDIEQLGNIDLKDSLFLDRAITELNNVKSNWFNDCRMLKRVEIGRRKNGNILAVYAYINEDYLDDNIEKNSKVTASWRCFTRSKDVSFLLPILFEHCYRF